MRCVFFCVCSCGLMGYIEENAYAGHSSLAFCLNVLLCHIYIYIYTRHCIFCDGLNHRGNAQKTLRGIFLGSVEVMFCECGLLFAREACCGFVLFGRWMRCSRGTTRLYGPNVVVVAFFV